MILNKKYNCYKLLLKFVETKKQFEDYLPYELLRLLESRHDVINFAETEFVTFPD